MRNWKRAAAGLVVFSIVTALAPWAGAASKVVRVVLDGAVGEAPAGEMDFSVLLGGEKSRTLRQWVKVFDTAAKDKNVAGIALIIENPQLGIAQVEELTNAMERFKGSGKKIFCFIDSAGNMEYALAASASHVTLAENSTLDIVGLHAELMFFKGLLDKIGVQADMMHCGDYKSALEPFTRTEPSPEAAEQMNWLLDGIYDAYVQIIADGRGLSPTDVKEAIDVAPLWGEDALKRKLIDEVGSFKTFAQLVRKEFGQDAEIVKKYPSKDKMEIDFKNPFAFFETINELFSKSSEPAQPGIGIVYIDGGISMGKSGGDLLTGGTSAGSTTIRAAFDKALRDENIKAVVVRVDSPGGSALASDIMWKAGTRVAKEKPVVVSMGNVAGSGGYYVALPGDVIFADSATITGSIGVVGGKMVLNGLFEDKLGITSTEFKRGKNADLFSTNRTWSESERAQMRNLLDTIYEQFKGRVMESRGSRIKGDLEKLAGGRVYTGQQALEIGLVDRIGDLHAAIDYAAQKAGLDTYEIYELPKPKDFGDVIAELMGQEREDEWEISASSTAPFAHDPLIRSALPLLQQLAPEKVRAVIGGLRNLIIVDREHVGVFMPFEMTLR